MIQYQKITKNIFQNLNRSVGPLGGAQPPPNPLGWGALPPPPTPWGGGGGGGKGHTVIRMELLGQYVGPRGSAPREAFGGAPHGG